MNARRLGPELGAGLAAALMALPMAMGNGLLAFAPLGPGQAVVGAVAGLVGAIVLGGVASAVGGAPGLVSSPSGPAAAMLSTHAAWLVTVAPGRAQVLLVATGLLAGIAQLVFGALRLGRVVKFIPYPVVSGFLSAAGMLLAWKQLPVVTGAAPGGLANPQTWRVVPVVVAVATFAALRLAPAVSRRIPPVLAGLGAGLVAWFAFAARDPSLAAVGNDLVVGAVPGPGAIAAAVPALVAGLVAIRPDELVLVLGPAAALATLLSVDTLKTCVLVDSVTGGRHAPSRELVAQGLGNVLASLGGGMAGSGVSGPTGVNVSAGGRTHLSSAVVPAALLLLVALAPGLVAGMPRALLGGILVHVGLKTVDWGTLRLLRHRERRIDFAVVVGVVLVAFTAGLVAASAAGSALVVVLFLRDRMADSPVRTRGDLTRLRSTRRRLPPEDRSLAEHGAEVAVLTLQGDLFFGTADRLLTELTPDLGSRRVVLLDLGRVTDVDLTAARILAQAHARLATRGGLLVLAGSRAPDELEGALSDVAVDPAAPAPMLFASRDEALEWAEERVLEAHLPERPEHARLALGETDLLAGLGPAQLAALGRHVETRVVAAGQPVFQAGDPGDALYLVAHGRVRLAVPAAGGRDLMIGAFGRGDVFGELAFVDSRPRSANAVAVVDTELFVLRREAFDAAAREEASLGAELPARIARVIAYRLRVTTGELRAAGE